MRVGFIGAGNIGRAHMEAFDSLREEEALELAAVTDVHEARASYDNSRARAIVARNTLMDAREALRDL